MRQFVAVLFIIFFAVIGSCRKDFSTIPSSGELQFSRDTVFLDTVFTNIGSATYNLKVYNRSNKDITIPNIQLENGNNSNYRLNVDGVPGKDFQNIDILAKDSIFIFVETTIDVTSVSDLLYTDKILFDNGINQQDVDLVTLVQDATFIYPQKSFINMKIDSLSLDGQPTTIKGRFLEDSELNFTNEKPYVIYGYAAVGRGKTLTIDSGTRVYFHDDSGLIIDKGGSIKINGTLDEKVVFEGDRLEHSFSTTPGQWGTIWLRAGSSNNSIDYAQIKNGIIGILIDSLGNNNEPTLHISNTEIINHANFGLLARQAEIVGKNVVIGSAGESSAVFSVGGNYNFTHSTFANSITGRSLPAVLVNNFFTTSDEAGNEIIVSRDLKEASFTNCIFEGNSNIELLFDKVEGGLFNFNVTSALVKFDDALGLYTNNAEMNFEDTNLYQNIILNGTPNFRNLNMNDFIIGSKSSAINKGNTQGASLVPFDILGVDRTTAPDLGAYQHIDF